jgi:ERCC4-type nuclease
MLTEDDAAALKAVREELLKLVTSFTGRYRASSKMYRRSTRALKAVEDLLSAADDELYEQEGPIG